MNNDRNTNCTDVAIKNEQKIHGKSILIYSLICIAIALISFLQSQNGQLLLIHTVGLLIL